LIVRNSEGLLTFRSKTFFASCCTIWYKLLHPNNVSNSENTTCVFKQTTLGVVDVDTYIVSLASFGVYHIFFIDIE